MAGLERQWGRLGIQSEVGPNSIVDRLNIGDVVGLMLRSGAGGWAYAGAGRHQRIRPRRLSWPTAGTSQGHILDPFAGGSVRGIVASTLARWYVGVDLRGGQVAANRRRRTSAQTYYARWISGRLCAAVRPSRPSRPVRLRVLLPAVCGPGGLQRQPPRPVSDAIQFRDARPDHRGGHGAIAKRAASRRG